MILIGLTGRKRAGKTTVTRWLVNQYGLMEVSFAAPLYRGLATMIGVDIGELQAEDRKEAPIEWLGKSPRQMLQTLGTEWGRGMVHDEIWIRVAARAIKRARGAGCVGVVVSDVRFDNEAEFIVQQGGTLWTIQRPQKPTLASDRHASESGISTNWPARGLVNGGSFQDLYARVDQLMEEMGAG